MVTIRQRFTGWLATLVCAAAVLGLSPAGRDDSAFGQVMVAARARPVRDGTSAKAVPMVNVDDELANYLTKAERLIKEKSYGEAIEILQAMMRRRELGFIPTEDGRRFVSLRVKASELIGKLDAEGLRKYRATADAPAQKLYTDAVEKLDTGLMREVVDRYLHTTYGPRALEALAQIDFDRGRFSQASYCWKQLLHLQKGTDGEAALLARLAVAYHLAGESDAADAAARELQDRFSQAQAELGGRKQNLAEFVTTVRKRTKGGFTTAPRAPQHGWPGLGALSGNFGTMSDCDVVLLPRWRYPDGDLNGKDVFSSLIARKGLFLFSPDMPRPAFAAKLRSGHVQVKWTSNPGYESSVRPGQQEFNLPAPVHPVVVGETVIFRSDDGVTACDLITGQKVWEAFGLPIERKVDIPNLQQYYGGYYPYGPGMSDNGRYAITVAEGRVFALCGFLPPIGNIQYALQRNPNLAKELGDTSSLAAVSLDSEGMLLWRIGEGRGEDDLIKGCKFLSAPAYHAGRLYVLAMFTENYHLICLNAETGAVIWRTAVAQTPAVYRGYYPGQNSFLDMGSIPAVMDGRVFVLTNSGVIAAYEADSGQPVWAYQYDSFVATGAGMRGGYYPGRRSHNPANPVITMAGKVICLPADSTQVIALAGEDGRSLWTADRLDVDDLTGIDDDRVLLSGERLLVLSTADGKKLPRKGDAEAGADDYYGMVEGIVGRPAVTPTAVLASGQGKLFRLDLKTYRLTSVGPAATEAILGNLVSVDGKLIAANSAGLAAYFSYDTARQKLSDRLAKAEPQEQASLLYQRAHLAFSARRFTQSLEDFQACAKLAEELNDSALASQVRPRLYRTYVALGNQVAKSEEMLEMFQKAQEYAETRQEKAHMMLRLAKYYRKIGELATATATAQEISEQFAAEELVDVRIGPDAEESVRTDAGNRTVRGKHLAQLLIREMIEVHGRDCYKKFDEQAREALKVARPSGDPNAMLAVAERWPNSDSADAAQFATAETYYNRAAADKDKADEYYGLAIGHLSEVANRSDSPLRVSATVALAVIYARGNKQIAARLTCDQVRDLPADTMVEFADIKGKLGDIIEEIQKGKVSTSPVKVNFVQTLVPPLKEQFKIEGEATFVLRDQEFRPVRVGEGVFVLQGNRAMLVDTAARSLQEATQRWVGLTSIDPEQLKQNPSAYGTRLQAGLSKDGKILAVCDATAVTGFETESAKRAWHKTMSDLGIGQIMGTGIGEGVLIAMDTVGNLTCVDLANGEVRWKANLVGGQNRQPNGAPIIGGGAVLTRHNSFRTLTCFGLESGKVMGKWEAQFSAEGCLTKEGLLVMLMDGVLSAREIGQLDKPFWTRKYEQNVFPMILAVENERVAISTSQAGGGIDVLSVMGGGELAKLSMGKVDAVSPIPMEGSLSGNSLYVVGSTTQMGRRKTAFTRTTNSRGLIVQKFDLTKKTSDPAWSASIDLSPNNIYMVMPLTVGQKHVALTAKHHMVGSAYYAYVLEAETGDVKEKFDLLGQGGQVKDQQRRWGIGPPVMTNGRLMVETTEGVTVYGGQ